MLLGIFGKAFEGIAADQGIARPFPVDECWPDYVWILSYPEFGTHLFITSADKLTALVCFSSRDLADAFVEALRDVPARTEGCVVVEVPFDEARKIAQDKDNVQALILLDAPDNPRFHFVS